MTQRWNDLLSERFGDDLHLRQIQARPGQSAPIPEWLHPEITRCLNEQGISHLWQHQLDALDSFEQGSNVVIATGTASGKSLCYQLPIIQQALTSPTSRALYIAPTKALGHDQSRSLIEWNLRELQVATMDGDTDSVERRFARDHANVVVTNPDMLHFGILGQHDAWAKFIRELTIIAVDECHIYRGVFGAQVSNVLKRLLRIARMYGTSPQIVMASATVSQPAAHAQMLTGRQFSEVTTDTSARGELSLALTLPQITLGTNIDGEALRRSAIAEASDALTDLVIESARTLVFVRSRKAAETVASITRDHLAESAPELVEKVTSYRAGYLPQERREIEARLRDGSLIGAATTTALELGVDISGLDAVVLTGWPGTRASFWQQVGRAGRDGHDARALLIASDNPLDQYLVKHPEMIFDNPVEASVCDPSNANVLGPHLLAAACELHLCEEDLELFGDSEHVRSLIEEHCREGLLKHRPLGWYWNGHGRAHSMVSIRGAGAAPYSIVEEGTGRIVGTIDAAAAFLQVHPGAIYVHLGETYFVNSLDIEESIAFVHILDVDYTTYAQEITSVALVEQQEAKRWGPFEVSRGIVDVTEHVIGFQRRRLLTGQILGNEPLDLPEQTLRTQGMWWTIPRETLDILQIGDVAGAAHAAEHAAIGLLPLFSMCDRWDIGGVSVSEHPDNGLCTIVIYDGQAGGAGFTHHGFAVADQWLSATRDVIQECECTHGCPGCVQSPKCGNNNNPLDKQAALRILDEMLRYSSKDQHAN